MNYDSIPWVCSKDWKKDCWYPMPLTFYNKDKGFVDGWTIFKLDPIGLGGDMTTVLNSCENLFSLRVAIDICEAHNGWSFDL